MSQGIPDKLGYGFRYLLAACPLRQIFLKYVLHADIEQLWAQNRDAILAEHVKQSPGTRPALKWRYDAPRQPMEALPGCY